MGVIRDLVKQVDASEQNAAEIKEALTVLMKLAETQAEAFEAHINNDLLTGKTLDNLNIPITKKIASYKEYRAYTSRNQSELISKITGSLQKIISGDGKIIESVGAIVNDGLSAIMGSGQGSESVVQSYQVLAEYPAIIRLDFAFWGRNIEAASIRKRVESAFSCIAVKSAVDVTKLAFNDFLALYGPILRKAFGDDQAKIKEMLNQSTEIYEMLNPRKEQKLRVTGDLNTLLLSCEQNTSPKMPFAISTRQVSRDWL